MNKNILYNTAVSLSGGVYGVIIYMICLQAGGKHLSPGGINYLHLGISVIGFSVVFSVLWALCALMFARVFKKDIQSELKISSAIFSIPLLLILLMVFYFSAYEKLVSVSFKVLGSVYMPFINYVSFNAAGYLLIIGAGLAGGAVLSVIAFRFIKSLYLNIGSYREKTRYKMIFICLTVFFGLFSIYITAVYPPTGDETHYLMITDSIVNDFDIDINNNLITEKTYKQFYPAELEYERAHSVPGKKEGSLYSLHSIGIPALISAVYKLSGRYGVALFMALFASLLGLFIYIFLRKNMIAERISLLGAALISLTVPLSVNSTLVLTEIPAAIIVLYCVQALYFYRQEKPGPAFFIFAAIMPWLHSKLIILSVIFYAWYYITAFRKKGLSLKTEALNNIPVFFSAFLYISFYTAVSGRFAPIALAQAYTNEAFRFIFSFKYMLKAFSGILFDRNYGIILYNPLYIVSIWGVMLLVFRKSYSKLVPLLLVLPYAGIYLFWNDWGGSMTPARQLIPVVPVFALYAAIFMQETDFHRTRLFKFFAGAAIAVSYILMCVPALRYAGSKDKIWKLAENTEINFMWLLPSFNDIITFTHLIAAVYIGLIVFLFFKYSGIRVKKG